MNQVHGNEIKIITKKNQHDNHTCDAIITQEKNVLLSVKTADCLPVLIYHPSGIIAAIHAGRKSTDLHILELCIKEMQSLCQSKKEFHIWFGPHISECEYEINKKTKKHYNLTEKNSAQIWGLLDRNTTHFIKHPACTVRHNNLFYSYRKEKEMAGRFYSTIMLNN